MMYHGAPTPPLAESPQATTEPSDFKAAIAPLVNVTDSTFTRSEETDELSPPLVESPHVTTVPSALIATQTKTIT